MSVIAAGTPAPELHARHARTARVHRAGPAGPARRCSSSTRSRSARSAPTSCSSTRTLRGELAGRGDDAVRRLLRLDAGRRRAFREKLGVAQRAAVGLRAQGRRLRGLRRAPPRRLPPARAGDHRPRRGRRAGATRPTRRASCRASSCCARASQPPSAPSATRSAAPGLTGWRSSLSSLRSGKEKKRNGPPTDGRNRKAVNMSSDAVTRVSVEIAGSEISFETGRMAKQASGAVVVRQGDTMVLVHRRRRAASATSTSSR